MKKMMILSTIGFPWTEESVLHRATASSRVLGFLWHGFSGYFLDLLTLVECVSFVSLGSGYDYILAMPTALQPSV